MPHVHMVAIGGSGMGAIAQVLLEKGYTVSGSDVAENDMTKSLVKKGAVVYLGHDATHVRGADMVVYSTAAAQDNPELAEARRMGVPVLHRSQMLARLMDEGIGIAVAGAHGKTTTTSMIAFTLMQAGCDPSFVVGGVVGNLGTGARAGTGPYVVAEADESDRSFLNYRPVMAVITNIEADHLEYYDGDFGKLRQAYLEFARHIQPHGVLVGCVDDPLVREVFGSVACRTVGYSVVGRADAEYRAEGIVTNPTGSRSVVRIGEDTAGQLVLRVPGLHNVGNGLAALAICRDAGISFSRAAAALESFRGALRRFERLYDADGITIIDDYAHHPTEIAATIHALRSPDRRIIAVFQPQRYTRTYHLFQEFAASFGEADEVIIADIYSPAGESPISGVSAKLLTDAVRRTSHGGALYCPAKEDVLRQLQEMVRSGDLVLTMGAGDIWKVGSALADWLREGAASRA